MSHDREPYDLEDREQVRSYLNRRGIVLVEPSPTDDDPFFRVTLDAARIIFTPAFGRRRPDGAAFRVFPVLRERSLPSASALDLKGLHVCAVDAGLVSACFELACFVFAQKNLFRDLGNPDAEASPPLPHNGLLGLSMRRTLAAAAAPPETMVGYELVPIDPVRRTLSQFLLQMMLRFAWLHELYHGLNGHAGLVSSVQDSLELSEIPELQLLELADDLEIGSVPLGRALHAFELDADRAAIAAMIHLQLKDEEPFEAFLDWPLAARMRLNLFAAFLMTLLFDHTAREFRRRDGVSHPAPFVRLAHLLQTAALIGEQTAGSAGESIGVLFSDLRQLQTRIPGVVSENELLNAMKPGAGPEDPIQNVLTDLAALQSVLAPFAFR